MLFMWMVKGCYVMGVVDDQLVCEEGYVFVGWVCYEMLVYEVCFDEFWIGCFEVIEVQW